ncbi:MAG: lipopolysaccharide heptosyltransferase II [Verrucomicrobia bacterium]|nr:lipopolysaccharide heptosyltransferase II [Verrucomicrobiota bacterium]
MSNPQSAIRNPHFARLLVRGVNWLGDAVMSLAALQRLREALPRTRIAVLTPSKLAELWRGQPVVDEVLAVDSGETVFGVARRIREGHFDGALILPNSFRSALESWLARVPQRVGVARPGRNWLLTRALPPRPDEIKMRKRSVAEVRRLIASPATRANSVPASAHHLHHYLHLAAALGASPEPVRPKLVVPDSAVAAVRQRFGLASANDAAAPLFGLNPGAEYGPAKRWPRERFVAAALELRHHTHCRWWIFGGPADAPLAESIAAEISSADKSSPEVARSLAGQTSLHELCAALKACSVVLTNDTGPMHVAAAVGTPVVVPFGSTSPELTGPGLPGDSRHRLLRSSVPCAPCFRRECPVDFRCMDGLAVASVVQAVIEAWRETAGRP